MQRAWQDRFARLMFSRRPPVSTYAKPRTKVATLYGERRHCSRSFGKHADGASERAHESRIILQILLAHTAPVTAALTDAGTRTRWLKTSLPVIGSDARMISDEIRYSSGPAFSGHVIKITLRFGTFYRHNTNNVLCALVGEERSLLCPF